LATSTPCSTVLVTGATSGIGRAIASSFAAEGAHVAISGRDSSRGDAVAAEIRESGGLADFLAADLVGSTATVRRLAREALEVLGGRVDVLVNNAGIFPSIPTTTLDEAAFDSVIAVTSSGLKPCIREGFVSNARLRMYFDIGGFPAV